MAVEEAELNAIKKRLAALEGVRTTHDVIYADGNEPADEVTLPTREEVRDAILDFSAQAAQTIEAAKIAALEEVETAKQAALAEIAAILAPAEKSEVESGSENQQG